MPPPDPRFHSDYKGSPGAGQELVAIFLPLNMNIIVSLGVSKPSDYKTMLLWNFKTYENQKISVKLFWHPFLPVKVLLSSCELLSGSPTHGGGNKSSGDHQCTLRTVCSQVS